MFSFPSFPFRKASKVGWRSSTGSDRDMSRSMCPQFMRHSGRQPEAVPALLKFFPKSVGVILLAREVHEEVAIQSEPRRQGFGGARAVSAAALPMTKRGVERPWLPQ